MNTPGGWGLFAGWLLKSSAQAALLVVLVLAVQWLLRRWLTPRWRYFLWWLVVARLLMPVSLPGPVSIFNWVKWNSPPAPAMAVKPSTPEVTLPASPPETDTTAFEETTPELLPQTPVPITAPAMAAPTRPPFDWRLGVMWLWLVGAALLGARLVWSVLRLRRELRTATPVSAAAVLALLDECRAQMQVRDRLTLLETPLVNSPALCGFWRPRLLLPPGLCGGFSASQLRFIFLHELAHVRRHDIVVNWLIALLQLLHWFNPLVWLAFARLRADRELACDALALSVAAPGEQHAYGQTIIRLLEGFARPSAMPGLVGILEDKNQMKRRIRMIAQFRRPGRWAWLSGIAAAILGIACLTDAQTPKITQRPGDSPPSLSAEPQTQPRIVEAATNQPNTAARVYSISGPGHLVESQTQTNRTAVSENPKLPQRRRTYVNLALDVRPPGFSAYDRRATAAVQDRCDAILDAYPKTVRLGKVEVRFELMQDGKIRGLKVERETVGDFPAMICQRAIVESVPFQSWPEDMRRIIGQDSREMKFTFFFPGFASVAQERVRLGLDRDSIQLQSDNDKHALSGSNAGPSTDVSHETMPSRMLGNHAFSNGMSVKGFNVQRSKNLYSPEGCEDLTGEIWLAPGSPQEDALVSPPFYQKYRMLISGDNGFAFINEFNGFKRHIDGPVAQVWANSFPRDSRIIHFRIEERETADSRDWSEAASFEVENPKPAQIEPWKAETLPRVMLTNGLEMEIGEISVRENKPNNPRSIWTHAGNLPVRFLSNGKLATNWGIVGGMIWDASGNYDRFTFVAGTTNFNDWTVYRMHRVLDPTKVWKFRLHCSRVSEFPATNLFSFTVPWPLSAPIQKDLGGFPVEIEFQNKQMLAVKLIERPERKRISFVSAMSEEGQSLEFPGGSMGQHAFQQFLKISTPTKVRITVAIHDDFETEFVVQPKWEKPATNRVGARVQRPTEATNGMALRDDRAARRDEMLTRMKQIRLPMVEFDSVPLSVVLEFLEKQAYQHDPEHRGVKFVQSSFLSSFLMPRNLNTNLEFMLKEALQRDPERRGVIYVPSSLIESWNPANTNRQFVLHKSYDVGFLTHLLVTVPGIENATLLEVIEAVVRGANRPIRYSVADNTVIVVTGSERRQ